MITEIVLYIFGLCIGALIIAVIVLFMMIKTVAEITTDRHFDNTKDIDNLKVKIENIIAEHNGLLEDQEYINNNFVKTINKILDAINKPELKLIKKQ